MGGFKEKCKKAKARRPDHPSYPDSPVVGPAAGLNCTQLLDVGSWQNATSPEEMAAIANPPSQGWF